jgi:hypothetical protein
MYKHTKHTKAHWSYRPVTSRETNNIFLETKEQCVELILESYSKLSLSGLIDEKEDLKPDLTNRDFLSLQKHIIKSKNKSIDFLKKSGIPHQIVYSLPLYFLIAPNPKKRVLNLITLENRENVPGELQPLSNFLKSRHRRKIWKLSRKNKNSSGKVVLKNNSLNISPQNKNQTSIKTAFEFVKLKKF